MLGGVIDVQFHPERLKDTPARVLALGQGVAVPENLRTQAITFKRQAEQAVLKDDHRRYQIALTYIKEDTERLSRLAQAKDSDSEKLAAQTRLLSQSLEGLQALSEKIPLDVLTGLKPEVGTTLSQAKNSLQALSGFAANLNDIREKLARTSEFLQTQIGKFDGVGDNTTGIVAGTQSEPGPDSKNPASPASAIPLRF